MSFAIDAQSFTCFQPAGHFVRWVKTGFSFSLYTFVLVAAFGVAKGSFLYSILTRKFRIEWFASWEDFAVHIIGGLLMGIGGVLAMGCTTYYRPGCNRGLLQWQWVLSYLSLQ